MEYKTDVLSAEHPPQTARVTNPDHVEKLPTMARDGRWVSGFGSFSVADKNPLSGRLSFPPPAVEGKLSVTPYFVDSFRYRPMTKSVDDSRMD